MFSIIDLETTGTDSTKDKILEIAQVHLHPTDLVIQWMSEHLVQPNVDIPPENSAVHHIIAEDLVNAPQLEEILHHYLDDSVTHYVAHNSRFEQSFLTTEMGFTKPWICTYKSALRLWPEAPGHKNQVLRYWFRTPEMLNREIGLPHRALPDCIVTAYILAEILKKEPSVEQLVEWSAQPGLLVKVGFGKHFGERWSEVEKSYLRWILSNGTFEEDVMFTARHYYG